MLTSLLCFSVLVTQPCLTLCDPMNCSLPGSSIHGILQAGILEWVAMPSSRGSSQPGIKPASPALQADSLLPEPSLKLIIYICTYIYMYIHTHTHIYIHIRVYVYEYIHKSICVCVCVCVYIHLYICTYIYNELQRWFRQ